MLGRDAPAVQRDDGRAEVVDRERNDPDRDARVAVRERGAQYEQRADELRGDEAEKRTELVGIAATRIRVQHQMEHAEQQIADAEKECIVAERAGDGERNPGHRRRRGEHRQTDAALVDVEGAREPRVARPAPPDRGQHEYGSQHAVPGRVVRQ